MDWAVIELKKKDRKRRKEERVREEEPFTELKRKAMSRGERKHGMVYWEMIKKEK